MLRADDWVEVKSPAAITQTLDEDGSLDGLPFMPEMAAMCGQRFRVMRRRKRRVLKSATALTRPGSF